MAAEATALASGGHDGIHEPLLHPEDNLPPTSPRALGRSISLRRSASLRRSTSLASPIGPVSGSLQRTESGCAAVLSTLSHAAGPEQLRGLLLRLIIDASRVAGAGRG